MSQYFRVFGRSQEQPAPATLSEELRRLCAEATVDFRGDELGWFTADVILDPETPQLRIERYLTKEDDIRAELNTWAAWLESDGDSPRHLQLMQQVINTAQLFTLHQPSEEGDTFEPDELVDNVAVCLCQFLARATNGIYQVDHRGFFAADGVLLVAEEQERFD